MKARLKILPDEPRGGAWPSSARGVNCPVKSGKPHEPILIITERETHESEIEQRACICDRPVEG